ncbi:MAG: FAD-dependent oxidoreductase, partial [Stomatobaculum sp.]|nr:FAD-dependent oxidoreductase [Stomatobaculum sp.]
VYGCVAKNEKGYIIADETCETNVPGIFAAGDVRAKQLRQIITAAADGANAVTSAERYLNSL